MLRRVTRTGARRESGGDGCGRALLHKRGEAPGPLAQAQVVVDGRTDPALAAALRAEVTRARTTLGAAPVIGSEAPSDPASGQASGVTLEGEGARSSRLTRAAEP
jgi:hypothetical protein